MFVAFSKYMNFSVWFKTTDTQFSSDTLLRWVWVFLNQTLLSKNLLEKNLILEKSGDKDGYLNFNYKSDKKQCVLCTQF